MRFLYVALISMLLAGCGQGNLQDLQDFVKTSGDNMRGQIPPPPEVKVYEPFAYVNDEELSNPFKPRKPDLRGGRAGLNQPDLDRPKEALEEFPLESLKMVGYLYQNKVGYAVVRAPDKKLHRVKAGNYVGLNFGLIEEVTDTEAIIKEMVQDSVGDWSERMSSLQLLEN
ncbi:MAG: pilus assembly protein PilP [Pseudomonadota bacterium]